MSDDRLAHQIAFLVEADKLKKVSRRLSMPHAAKLRRALLAPRPCGDDHARTLGGRSRLLRVEMVAVHDPSRN
jgi:hypothetical protein